MLSDKDIYNLSLDWWEVNLSSVGIVRDHDRLVGDSDDSKLSLDLGGKMRRYDKKALYAVVQSAERA